MKRAIEMHLSSKTLVTGELCVPNSFLRKQKSLSEKDSRKDGNDISLMLKLSI
jgi:hypothetical protein